MPNKEPYVFEQFAAIRRYGVEPALVFSPDGSEIAYTVNTSGQYNLWKQPSSGGFPQQLTIYTEHAVRSAAWSPDGKTIAFMADHHGDELYHLYVSRTPTTTCILSTRAAARTSCSPSMKKPGSIRSRVFLLGAGRKC